MKKLMAITAAAALSAGAVAAQETTQAGVIGASGNATYSVQVQGTNGVIYNCRPEIQTIDGVRARSCIRAGDGGGGLLGAGAGLTGGAVAGVGALVLVAIAAGSDGSTSTTTTVSP